jgi:hypothetical protein
MTLTYQADVASQSTDILFYPDLQVPASGADLDYLFFNTRFMAIVNAVNELAATQAGYATTESDLVSLGLDRINTVLGPLLTLLQEAATTGFLVANADGPSVSLTAGQPLDFTINSAGLALFTPTPWLVAQDTTDINNWGLLSLTSYNPTTGLLAAECVFANKTESSTNWNLSCSAGVIPAMLTMLAEAQLAQSSATISVTQALAAVGSLATLAAEIANGPVISVCGHTGTVALGTSDITGLPAALAALVSSATYVAGLAGKQNSSGILTSFSGLSFTQNMLPYSTSASTFGLTAFTAFAQGLLACANAASFIVAIGAATSASVATQISAATINSNQLNAVFDDQVGTAYTFAQTDNGEIVTLTNSAAIVATLPNTLAKGWNVLVYQGGAGVITFGAASGATLRNRQNQYRTAGTYAVVSLLCVSNTTGTNAVVVLGGDTQT